MSTTTGCRFPSFSLIILPISCVSKGSLLTGVPSTKQLKSFNEIPSEKMDCVPNKIFLSLVICYIVFSLSVKSISPVIETALSPQRLAQAFRKATRSDTTKTLCPSAAYLAAIILTL